MLTTYWIRLKM